MTSESELVLLVGFMGAGKTTVGRELARLLNWSFYDLDALIEGRSGRTVPALFAEQGESGFRKLEVQTLRELLETLEDEPAVVALGGGAFAQESIRQTIRDYSASVVHLDVGFEEALRRCADAPGHRPLMSDRAQATLLYEERLPFYRTAELQLATDGEAPAVIAQRIAVSLQLSPRDKDQEVQ
jgi:shikimate kinase